MDIPKPSIELLNTKLTSAGVALNGATEAMWEMPNGVGCAIEK